MTTNAEKLVVENMNLVYHLAKRFSHPQVDREDIISIGSIGLIKASRTYQEGKGAKFATYASRCISNEILMAFRKERNSTSSLDDPAQTGWGNNLTLLDMIPSPENVDDDIERIFSIYEIRKLIDELPVRDQFIVKAYYGIGCESMLQSEIGAHLNVAQSHVARILKGIKNKLLQDIQGVQNMEVYA